MNRKLAALGLCASLLGTPAFASDAATGILMPEMEPIQSALLQTGSAERQAAPIKAKGVAAASDGSPFSPVKLSSAPSICAGEAKALFYYYSNSAPEAALPSCSSDAPVVASQALPEFTMADASLTEAAAVEEPGIADVPIVVNKSVESFIRYFQTSGRKYFEKWLGRSSDYMAMLQTILRENGLPEDLSYIAFIESGLNPTVRSRANAVGMWQFIKGTAQRYGLRVDWWIDERMDPEKATYAAAKYFKNLYGMFGSWYLAAASYNAGEGRVSRAIKKHGTEDFWELASQRKPLHRETREYVPKYLAAVTIARDPELYGFTSVELNDGLRYEKVKVSQATDLRVIAEAAGTSVDEIKRLNPELLRWFTPPNYPGYEVKIPAGRGEIYRSNMSNVPPAKRIAFLQHKVKRGETLNKIAKRYGIAVSPILYLNNTIVSNPKKKLKPGMLLMIPVKAGNYASRKKSVAVAEIVTRMELQS
ncbi:MAG: hypothetical protein A2V21_305970 [Deltaproteobacteria bacterium GWC2_55_46]|nr:MAG: hypothetical protein A2Z79_00065 [Deltaproteobacteria bacterium GWA2_55_82]OGQ64968.1 MAG: hypothetical protein A3I81_01805 [Deltaproteobacteria bacterium RIFCSPLOWO2_02_FULL_55_12]OIJ73851.1 MAG: hypothetical protein A2V21_305970 [Deltaproteobacteria bacterium GWC2_55_46]